MNNDLPAITQRFFRAMQAGATAEADMMALFDHNAEYTEPFSGGPLTHRGIDAIRRAFTEGWKYPLPDMTIETERFEIDGERIVVDWICRSPALPGGVGRGTNEFRIVNGLIRSLVTNLRGEFGGEGGI